MGPSWEPFESTLLQVFVSIQAMIFNEYPWLNEPTRETRDKSSLESFTYNEMICVLRKAYSGMGPCCRLPFPSQRGRDSEDSHPLGRDSIRYRHRS